MNQSKYNVTRIRQSALSPAYWNTEARSDPRLKKMHGAGLNSFWLAYTKKGLYQAGCLQKEWDAAAQVIIARLLADKAYVRKLQQGNQQQARRIDSFVRQTFKIDMPTASFSKLLSVARQAHALWIDFDLINTSPWYIGGDDFREQVSRILRVDLPDFMFLTTPLRQTRGSLLDYELLKSALAVGRDNKNIERLAQKLSDKFGWLPFGYDGPEYWDMDYFKNKIFRLLRSPIRSLKKKISVMNKAAASRRQKWFTLIRQYKINGNKRRLLDIVNLLAQWTDDRKYYHFRLHYQYARVLEELSRRFDMGPEDLKFLFTEELKDLRTSARGLMVKARKRNRAGLVFIGRHGVVKLLPQKSASSLFVALKTQINISELTGKVGSRGPKPRYKATVKVILSPADSYKVKNGEFIVTTMTSPDYITVMKRAAGFITDEGGVTCHAAIVGREMNKPAIIGTKIATQVLKDGDKVEVDAEKGVVRKLT